MELEYFPTELLWLDMHTKLKQGISFQLDSSMLMNIPVEYNDGYEKNTNPLFLPTTEEPQFIPYIDPYTEARYAVTNNLNHQRRVLRDSINSLFMPASKAKNQANSGGANLLSPRTPVRTKILAWVDVARGNWVASPTRSIKVHACLSTKMTATNVD